MFIYAVTSLQLTYGYKPRKYDEPVRKSVSPTFRGRAKQLVGVHERLMGFAQKMDDPEKGKPVFVFQTEQQFKDYGRFLENFIGFLGMSDEAIKRLEWEQHMAHPQGLFLRSETVKGPENEPYPENVFYISADPHVFVFASEELASALNKDKLIQKVLDQEVSLRHALERAKQFGVFISPQTAAEIAEEEREWDDMDEDDRVKSPKGKKPANPSLADIRMAKLYVDARDVPSISSTVDEEVMLGWEFMKSWKIG